MSDAEASDFFAGFEVPSAFDRHTLGLGRLVAKTLAQTLRKRVLLTHQNEFPE
jgi:hypothetical protein